MNVKASGAAVVSRPDPPSGAVPSRQRRVNGDQTRQLLLQTAVRLWSEQGLLGVTMSAVAQQAGKTRRTVYHHFASQEVLVEAMKDFVDTELTTLAGGDFDNLPADPWGFVAGLAADNPDLVRSRLMSLLRESPSENTLMTSSIAHYRRAAQSGRLRPGIPPEHAAAISLAMWFAAVMTVSMTEDEAGRREQARKFAVSYERLLCEGILAPYPAKA